MKKVCIALGLLILATTYTSCKNDRTPSQSKSLTKEIQFKNDGIITIYKQDTDAVLKNFTIEVAEGDYETQTGLMYRKSMDKDNGMLFLFDTPQVRAFYMKNTEIPLDIIYIDKNKKIVKIHKDAKPMDPTSLSSETPVQYVLELNGGVVASKGILVGDRVKWILNEKK